MVRTILLYSILFVACNANGQKVELKKCSIKPFVDSLIKTSKLKLQNIDFNEDKKDLLDIKKLLSKAGIERNIDKAIVLKEYFITNETKIIIYGSYREPGYYETLIFSINNNEVEGRTLSEYFSDADDIYLRYTEIESDSSYVIEEYIGTKLFTIPDTINLVASKKYRIIVGPNGQLTNQLMQKSISECLTFK